MKSRITALSRILIVSIYSVIVLFLVKLTLPKGLIYPIPPWALIIAYILFFVITSEGNLYIDKQLDKKLPWFYYPKKRLYRQLIYTLLWSFFIMTILYVSRHFISDKTKAHPSFPVITLIATVVFIIGFNSYYLAKNFFNQWRSAFLELNKQQLELVNNKYEQLFYFLPIGIIQADNEGNITEYNNEAGKLLEFSKLKKHERSLVNLRWKRIKRDGTQLKPEDFVSIKAIKEQRLVENVEVGVVKDTKDITWLNVSAIPSVDGRGVVVSYMDITDKVARENKLQELNATKNKFFSIISHDLKNPFNALIGFSDLLLENNTTYDEKEREELLKMINDTSKNTFELLESLLAWARSQSGGLKIEQMEVNLKLVADEITALLLEALQGKKINLINNISEEINVFADYNMLETVIRNLVTNAVKYSHQNGTITLSAIIENDFATVKVSDNGIGMDEKTQDTLFKIGETRSTEGTASEMGTGLGLILCKEFIEKHGGKIWVESEEDKGSDFMFTIPLQNNNITI